MRFGGSSEAAGIVPWRLVSLLLQLRHLVAELSLLVWGSPAQPPVVLGRAYVQLCSHVLQRLLQSTVDIEVGSNERLWRVLVCPPGS